MATRSIKSRTRSSVVTIFGLSILLALNLAACVRPVSTTSSPPGPAQTSPTPASLSLPSANVAPLPTFGPPTPTSALPTAAAPVALPTLPTAGLPSATPLLTSLPSEPPTATPDLTQMGRDSWLSLSPDGVWQAEVEVYFPAQSDEPAAPARYYTRLIVRHASGSPAWTVVDEWRDFGLGATTPIVFFWSPRDEYVLVADSGTPDGCALFGYTSHLRRVYLTTGAVQPWSSDLQGVLAITPDGDLLIVFENPAPSLRLVDVNASPLHVTRAERQLTYSTLPGEWQAGGARWDPSGKLLAFTAYPAACPPEVTYIYTLDPLSGDIEVILDGASGWLDIQDWTTNGLLLGDQGGSRWLLDPLADTLTALP
jgi:hypothetical protein